MLENFRVATFEFILSALERIVLPPYKGSTFRGGFGSTFRKIVCTTKSQRCEDCIVKLKCPYSYIFETPPPKHTEIMRKYPHVPHPFVIEPPADDRDEYAEGDNLRFGLILVGKAIEYLPYFIFTFEELGKNGSGLERGKYRLQQVKADFEGKKGSTIYSSVEKKLKDDFPTLTVSNFRVDESKATREVKLRFLTPVRIKYRDSYRHQMEFHVLLRNLLRRIGSLDYFHCGGKAGSIDYRALISAAKSVASVERNLSWNDWNRYSKRQQQGMNLGGFTGEISYKGDIGEFWSFLRVGELIHVGKGTTFGLGKYQISIPPLVKGSEEGP